MGASRRHLYDDLQFPGDRIGARSIVIEQGGE